MWLQLSSLRTPLGLAAPTKTAASCGLAARGGGAGEDLGGGGHICLLCVWTALRVHVSEQLTESEGNSSLCRPDHKHSLHSSAEGDSINNLGYFG